MSAETDRTLRAGVSVVVPAYRSAGTLTALVRRLEAVLADVDHEIVLVEDGANDGTWDMIRVLADSVASVRGLRLGRNAGQHAALLAGVRAARFSVTVTLDDDLQNPPEEVLRLVAALEDRDLDLVYGSPALRATSRTRGVGGTVVRWVLSRLTGLDLLHISSFRCFRTRLRQGAAAVTGPRVVLDPVLHWGTDRIGHIDVEHHPRTGGTSGYSLRRLLGFAIDMVTGYSTRPLRATTWLGFTSAGFGLLVLLYVVLRYLLVGTTVAGFPFLASTIAMFAGAQLVALGVIGEYLARMHLRILGQPAYVIAEEVGVRTPGRVGDVPRG